MTTELFGGPLDGKVIRCDAPIGSEFTARAGIATYNGPVPGTAYWSTQSDKHAHAWTYRMMSESRAEFINTSFYPCVKA